ncbi:AraC family L-rhamnose operon transcriptional activator RhaR [Paenibacillus phyllosphaerae]|uniref:AraC family L-rhamnose operon transcriptional activator RhaR n=1 Tax=Paenibacillus phyllosphaerae TaxID=274593 RepID=A0A7W5AZL5_9BACL|nr:AraC family transcriptional regulator [Paenibacillus phyllosphaerae]MBB3111557.1 AraC family L-rhamnose operon transcriptional activator RhaR [Paenibacillus phyllosphaerae]
MSKRTVRLLSGDQYFDDKLSIYVNRNTESYELTEHHHDFLELSYVSEGTGTHHAGSEVSGVTSGDLFVIPVGSSHVFRPASLAKDRPLIVYNCIVTMDAVTGLLHAIPGGQELQDLLALPQICHLREPSGEADRLFSELYREYAIERTGRQTALYAGLLQLLVLIARLLQSSAESAQIPRTADMDAIVALLRKEYARTFNVSELAAKLGIGERQFQRLFQQHTGLTLTSYVQRLRIQAACRLLQSTSRKVSDISEAVGYANVPFFHELFKKQMGLSPRAYRRSLEPTGGEG